jgi:hypothetical protein
MKLYPVEIRRCQHIKTNGTQCGSPALRDGKFCYHHQECRPERVEVCGEGSQTVGQILFPVFEDATSIQMVVRQVAMMVLQKKIDHKAAGLVLYACQIASTNLKRMDEEKPRPVQVVVDTEKVVETPLGMTPWSGKSEGHEIEEPADDAAERALDEVNGRWEREYQNKKELIEGRVQGIDEVLCMHPEADREKLYSHLSFLHTSLELAASSMKDHLEAGAM